MVLLSLLYQNLNFCSSSIIQQNDRKEHKYFSMQTYSSLLHLTKEVVYSEKGT